MSRKTTNLDLTLSGPDDSGMDYQTYEYSQSGYTGSNMTKIDGAFGAPLGTLTTSSKSIVPAINEVKTLAGGDVRNASDIGVSDANNLPIGWFSGNLSNSPISGEWATYHTFYKLGESYRTQIAYGINNPFIFFRNFINGSYQPWEQLATTEVVETPLTLLSGLEGWAKKAKSVGSVNFGGTFSSTTSIAQYEKLFYIDEIPLVQNSLVNLSDSQGRSYFCVVKSDGLVETQVQLPQGTYYISATIIVR
ncbi:MAG: hypothetical protein ACRDDY_19225 [Clostridium sp.]|uniref:hypothetical protein n=1 Tax=Clostridium sp. TaxID=1506 RepID=UPI003EE7025C